MEDPRVHAPPMTLLCGDRAWQPLLSLFSAPAWQQRAPANAIQFRDRTSASSTSHTRAASRPGQTASAVALAFPDHSQVEVLRVRFKSVNLGAGESPG